MLGQMSRLLADFLFCYPLSTSFSIFAACIWALEESPLKESSIHFPLICWCGTRELSDLCLLDVGFLF